MRFSTAALLDDLRQVADLPEAPDPLAQTAPLVSLDTRLMVVMGQNYPALEAGLQWQMSNNALYYYSRALAIRLTALEQASATQQQVTALLVASFGATSTQLATLRASIELVHAAGLATQSQLEANATGDVQLTLRVQATEQQLAADQLADVARTAHEASQDAQLEALRLRAVAGEAASAEIKLAAQTAEARATSAQASASQAIADAANAQRLASQAKAAADAAQKTADQATAQAATNASALTTVAADVATRLPAAMVQRFTITTPQLTVQAGVAATFNVPLPKAFADNQYLVFFTKGTGAALLNVQLSDTAKLPGSFTGTMQQTGLVQLLVQSGQAEVLAFHL